MQKERLKNFTFEFTLEYSPKWALISRYSYSRYEISLENILLL